MPAAHAAAKRAAEGQCFVDRSYGVGQLPPNFSTKKCNTAAVNGGRVSRTAQSIVVLQLMVRNLLWCTAMCAKKKRKQKQYCEFESVHAHGLLWGLWAECISGKAGTN